VQWNATLLPALAPDFQNLVPARHLVIAHSQANQFSDPASRKGENGHYRPVAKSLAVFLAWRIQQTTAFVG
jgi:hypothetical protein